MQAAAGRCAQAGAGGRDDIKSLGTKPSVIPEVAKKVYSLTPHGPKDIPLILSKQQKFPFRKCFISGCLGRELSLDLRVHPAPLRALAASLVDDPPTQIRLRINRFAIIEGRKGSKASTTWAQIGFFRINFPALCVRTS